MKRYQQVLLGVTLAALLGVNLLGAFAMGVTYQDDYLPLRNKVGDTHMCNALDINTGRLIDPWPIGPHGACYLRDNAWGHIKGSIEHILQDVRGRLPALP